MELLLETLTPDEFRVRVAKFGGAWVLYDEYPTRADAMRMVSVLADSGEYDVIAIEPHVSAAGMFQTHPSQEVWRR